MTLAMLLLVVVVVSQVMFHLWTGCRRLPALRRRQEETVQQSVWLGDLVQRSWRTARPSTGRQSRQLHQTTRPTTAAEDCVCNHRSNTSIHDTGITCCWTGLQSARA